ncbi:hypothetical protein ABW06_23355 [Pluralibacter gergoviae]|uniref:Uncharacterized protein n=1 Tax=Pluralibacter gergoviae TaxID=61647 RepID=A0A0J5KTZ3_PLUGE|nr:hypothetical protein ABW06_23355 [Pluralibacter gergoviae]
MRYSSRILQKVSDISDGKVSLSPGLRISIPFDSWSERLDSLRCFLRAAAAALLNKELVIIYYNIDTDKVISGNEKSEK